MRNEWASKIHTSLTGSNPCPDEIKWRKVRKKHLPKFGYLKDSSYIRDYKYINYEKIF